MSGSSLPGFRTSLSGSDALHVQGRVEYVIHKGGPKIKKKTQNGREYEVVGKDLGQLFRFAPKTQTEALDRDTGQIMTLDQLFAAMPFALKPSAERPFPTATVIPVRILGFDHLRDYDPVHNFQAIQLEVSRWARWQAHAASMTLARTDPFGRYLTQQRVNGTMVSYQPEEKEVPITLNEPGKPFYNKDLANGLECYLHEGKLYPWTAAGALPLYIPEMHFRGGVTGHGQFVTTSKYDINGITGELLQIVVMACQMGARLSELPILLYREETEISAVNFDQNMPISQRRAKRQSVKKWLVHIKLEPKVVHALMAGSRQQESRFLERVASGGFLPAYAGGREDTVKRINEELGLPTDDRQTARPTIIIQEQNGRAATAQPQVGPGEETGDDYEEGVYEEEGAATPERPWLAQVVAAADAADFTAFFVEHGNIPSQAERQAAWKALKLKKESTATREGKAQTFVALCLYGEGIGLEQEKPADYANSQMVEALRGIELPPAPAAAAPAEPPAEEKAAEPVTEAAA